jgi:hypothetical protein
MVELLNAVGTQRMATVYKYPGYSFSNIVLLATELADVKSPWLIVEVHNIHFSNLCNYQIYNYTSKNYNNFII